MPSSHVAQTIARLYSSELSEDGVIPALEAEIDYSLFSELATTGIDTGDARESILTGYASFAAVNLPDAKSLSPEQLQKVQQAIVKYVLQSGSNGFKDGIAAIEFDGDNPFKGKFTQAGNVDRQFAYEIEQQGGQYVSSVSVLTGVED